jgi:hypothetical protein
MLFNSCTPKPKIDYSLLEGNWIHINQINKEKKIDPVAPPPWQGGSFALNLRNNKGDIYDSTYKIIKDTIFFKMPARYNEKTEHPWYSRYTIQSLTKDTLVLYSLRDSTIQHFFNAIFIKDTSIHVSRICFTSSICLGTCPSINLEINKDNTVHYKGSYYTKLQGYYTGKISQATFSYFEGLIQETEYQKLDSVYNYGVTDNQAIGLNIFYTNGKSKSVYIYPSFYFDMPVMHNLFEDFLRLDSYFPLTKCEAPYDFKYNRFPNNL